MLKLIFTNELSLENEGLREKYITKLENTIIKYNSELLLGMTFVDDETYNNCIELLTMLRPNSPLLKNDKPVFFVKEFNEESVFALKSKVSDLDNLKFYLNPMGLNVRLTYEFGELISAVTFGRSFKNRDILDLMTMILTNRNDSLDGVGHVEIEGVLTLPFDNVNMASEFCYVKNPYQGLFSLIRHNEVTEEIDNLEDFIHFVATDIFIEGIPFDSINSKYELLEAYEFVPPVFFEQEKSNNLVYDLEDALYQAEYQKSEYPYQTDGLRLLTNTDDIILLRSGSWGIKTFSGVVKEIQWVDEKCKKVPKLIFEEPINITDEIFITDFVLNSINLLLILDVVIGGMVNFAYFGDMGILPITENNEIIIN